MSVRKQNVGRFCEMCGAVAGDYWQTYPTKPVLLGVTPRAGDPGKLWTICSECFDGLRELNNAFKRRKASGASSRIAFGKQRAWL